MLALVAVAAVPEAPLAREAGALLLPEAKEATEGVPPGRDSGWGEGLGRGTGPTMALLLLLLVTPASR